MSRAVLIVVALLGCSACRVASAPIYRIDTLEPGSAECVNGGVAVHAGDDHDGDFTLSDDEISSTDFVCNGTAGTDGDDGDDGSPGDDGDPGEDGVPVVYIDTDTTWSVDTEVVTPTVVLDGATLTVEPGVTVTLLAGAGLWVEGVLDLRADTSDAVRIEARYPTGDDAVYLQGTTPSTVDAATFDQVDLWAWGSALDSIADASFDDAGVRLRDRTAAFTITGAQFGSTGGDPTTAVSVQDLDELAISTSGFDGVTTALSLTRSTATLSASSVANTTATAVYADLASDLTLDTVTIDDSASYCVLSDGVLSITGATIDGCRYDGVRSVSNTSITDTTVRNARYAVWHDWDEFAVDPPPDFTGTDLTVSNSLRGVWVQTDGLIELTRVAVSDVAPLECFYVDGTIDGDTLSASNCGSDGIQVQAGGDITGLTVADAGAYGIIYGGVGSHDIGLSDVSIDGVRNDGVRISTMPESIMLSDITIADAGVRGIYAASGGALSITGLTITGSGNDGMYSLADSTTISDAVVTSSGEQGIEVQGSVATLTDVAIDGAGSYGIWVEQGDLDFVSITNAASHGINVDGWGAGFISNSDIRNNGANGVQCRHSNDDTRSMFDVLDNNIVGNAGVYDLDGSGVDHCRHVDGNYIALNGDADDYDDEHDHGTLDDGDRDSDGDNTDDGHQIEDADRIGSRATAELTGTGPR